MKTHCFTFHDLRKTWERGRPARWKRSREASFSSFSVSPAFFAFLALSMLGYRPAAAQEPTIAAIKHLGGAVELDEQMPGKPIIKVDLHGTAVTDSDLKVLEGLTSLRHLDLRLTKIGDEGVAHLKGLTRLRFLNLFRTQTTDRGLEQLRNLTELETLLIGGTKVTDSGLATVKGFSRLKKLSVFDTQVGDDGIKQLAALAKLEELLIGKSKVTEEGAKQLKFILPNLRTTEP